MTVTILQGDVRAKLLELEADSFDCVVTSPPYWGLRDYGVVGQIGLEPTLGEHLAVMVEVMREVRRVLKPTGTLWLNYGDCYSNTDKWGGGGSNTGKQTVAADGSVPSWAARAKRVKQPGLKPKDLCMVPNRLAIALQEDGWWVRSEIIWAKPNPMPESISDRPASSHEKIFLLSRAPRYHYDAQAVRQPGAASSDARLAQNVEAQEGSHRANGGAKTNGTMKAVGGARRKQDATAAAAGSAGGSSGRRMAGFNDRWDAKEKARLGENANGFRGGSYVGGEPGPRTATGNVLGTGDRNLRNYEPAPVQVWNLATQPFSEAHFATFPPELAARALAAGCPAGGTCLDPFGGAGTVGLVAESMGLDCTLIELNPDYAKIAANRIRSAAVKNEVVGVDHQDQHSALPLFQGAA